MDLARAPRRAPLTARKKGSGYENGSTIHNSVKKTGASKIRKHVKNRELPAAAITHATRQHEHSKWRLNRSKIIERDREKPCFRILRLPTVSDPVEPPFWGKN